MGIFLSLLDKEFSILEKGMLSNCLCFSDILVQLSSWCSHNRVWVGYVVQLTKVVGVLHAGACRAGAAALLISMGEATCAASIGSLCGCVRENWCNIPSSSAPPLCNVTLPLPVH